jgi:hypothetical protein
MAEFRDIKSGGTGGEPAHEATPRRLAAIVLPQHRCMVPFRPAKF